MEQLVNPMMGDVGLKGATFEVRSDSNAIHPRLQTLPLDVSETFLYGSNIKTSWAMSNHFVLYLSTKMRSAFPSDAISASVNVQP